MRHLAVRAAFVVAITSCAVACGSDDPTSSGITLLTHDSFAVSTETFEEFTAETGIEIEVLTSGDTGQLVSEAVLTAGNPLGDVLFGIDNTFLQRGIDAELFEPYESPALASVPVEYQVDDAHRVTPITFGDVCVNYWKDALPGPAPTSLDDLVDPVYADQLVVQNPETSSPGLAFLLATIAQYGDGWTEYWAALRDNGVTVTSGWEEAYYGEFVAGGGDRSLVVSYASSPPAEVIFAAEPIDEPPTGVITATCYRQIEFAGILAGTDHPDEAAQFIDFMLSRRFQEDVPLNMFVFPVSSDAQLPPEFADHADVADDPLVLAPETVETNRDEWTDTWVETVLR